MKILITGVAGFIGHSLAIDYLKNENNTIIGIDNFSTYSGKEIKDLRIKLLKRYKKHQDIVFVTVAGMSNALSGVVACNTSVPVIACPPFKDNTDMMVNINSTLQMPSNVPVMTVLSTGNAATCVKRILNVD